MNPTQRKELLDCILTIENTKSDMLDMTTDRASRDAAGFGNDKAWNELYKLLNAVASRSSAYDTFYDDVSCLFAEGVEFLDKVQLYNAFKEGFLKLKERLK